MNGLFSDHGSVTPTPMDEKRSTDLPGILRESGLGPRKMNTDIPNILPHEQVFPIQIGQELFRLSGASISSDGMYTITPISPLPNRLVDKYLRLSRDGMGDFEHNTG